MLAKLISMMSRAMDRKVFIPMPKFCVSRLISIEGRATCMLVSRMVLGIVRTASGLRFLSSTAVISRSSFSTTSPCPSWTSQMVEMVQSSS